MRQISKEKAKKVKEKALKREVGDITLTAKSAERFLLRRYLRSLA